MSQTIAYSTKEEAKDGHEKYVSTKTCAFSGKNRAQRAQLANAFSSMRSRAYQPRF